MAKRARAKAKAAAKPEAPAHYRLSPSGASRWLVCPYSAQHNLPDESGPPAKAGTVAHEKSCSYLKGEIETLLELEDEVYERTEGIVDRTIAASISAAASYYVQYVASLNGTKVYETKIEHGSIPDFGGTIDAAILDGTCLEVADLKSGTWRVPAENNPQLMSYLCLARPLFPEATEFIGTIIQPRTNKLPKTSRFSGAQLDIFEQQVKIAGVSDKKQTGDHCRFCPLRSKCNEGTEYAKSRNWN